MYKTYTTSELGISETTGTLQEIANALPVNSMVNFYISKETKFPEICNELISSIGRDPIDGIIEITHYNADIWGATLYIYNSPDTYSARYTTINDAGWTDWSKMNNTQKTGFTELLWSGSLDKGKTAQLPNANWKQYTIFMAFTSDGLTALIGMRNDSSDNANIRFTGGYDDGTNSYVFSSNTTIGLSTNVFKNACCSKHILTDPVKGFALKITKLYGVI